MSDLGQKQTSVQVREMSALPPKADVAPREFVPFISKYKRLALACAA